MLIVTFAPTINGLVFSIVIIIFAVITNSIKRPIIDGFPKPEYFDKRVMRCSWTQKTMQSISAITYTHNLSTCISSLSLTGIYQIYMFIMYTINKEIMAENKKLNDLRVCDHDLAMVWYRW